MTDSNSSPLSSPGSILGNNVRRVEDPRFITGTGSYLDDKHLEGLVHMASVRSQVPHGIITGIDADGARRMPGVIGVYTAGDLGIEDLRGTGGAPADAATPIPARDRVRYVGDVVAVVVAETHRQAMDAADQVWVDIDPLPAVATAAAATAPDAPVIWDSIGSNVVATKQLDFEGDPLEDAEITVSARFENQRMTAVPLEPNSAIAYPDHETGGIELWAGTQNIFGHRNLVANALGMDADDVRGRMPDIGGGFGAKFAVYPQQILVAALARELQRPVKWIETRAENMTVMTQGRDQVQLLTVGATRQGKITGLQVQVDANVGAYPTFGVFLPGLTLMMSSGVYDIPNIAGSMRCIATNTTPVHAYRGAGRPEAASMLERIMDMLAAELGIDPAEIRRRNFIPRDRFPLETASGGKYDVGDYGAALDRALEMAGYGELREEQRARRERGDRVQLGIGVSTYVEVTAIGRAEWGSVEVDEDGGFTALVGTSGHGQGHETAFAQIVSELFHVPLERVRVIEGDTKFIPKGGGTGGSRSLQIGGSVILQAGEGVIEKAKRLYAHLNEANVDDVVVFDDGTVGVAGVPSSGMTWAELAVAANDDDRRPGDMDPGLTHATDFEQAGTSFPFGSHVCVVEVDTETGDAKVLRHIAVDDCGRIFSRLLVDGQVHGGVAQGIGQALLEHCRYDDDANPLTANLVSYLIPAATNVPMFEVDHTETPTPLNPLGAKGIGESGTIGATPAVQNAIVDAVSHLGVTNIDMPATPSRIWSAIRAAS